ncbi:lytic transglycosylase domain-containing protein [Aestuariivirga sp.]|uniref:lytic transglycosylase domain-containing protein n=1 Tax=Aestuariivirga sp. TaxID=2650926 RepID=UPI0035939278
MRIDALLRVSFLALAAVTASVSPSLYSTTGTVMAEPKVSGQAVQAAKLALKGDFVAAGQAAQKSGDGAAIKLVELIYLRDHPNDAGYQRIMAFLDAAPKWPLTESLLKRAERSLYVNAEPADLIISHFNKRKPTTSEGSLALARALLATGDRDGARRQVQKVWSNAEITAELEKSIASEFSKLLTVDDHKRRMWRLVYAQETNAAIRASKRLPGEYQKAAAVAQKLLRGEAGADKAYSKLPSSMRETLGMKYALTRFYRKKESYTKARAILAAIPGEASKMGDAEAWWIERRIVARHSIGIKTRSSAKAAYQISAAHGFAKGEEALEGEFLAGWIALRYLKKPETALNHFSRLAEIAESRTEKARAGYWTGRTLEAMGRKGDAKSAYKNAAQYSTVYYGQLAREKVGLGKVPEEIESGKASAAAEAKVFKDEAVRAFKMVAEAGGKNELYMFLWSFANRFQNADEMNAAADVVWTAGGATMAVRLAKASAARNIDIDSWGYPVRALPDWKQIGPPVEKPLVFALARQESEFNPTAGSKVGAQGLMQIMPGTAKMIAKKYGLKYAEGMLKGDPPYNVKLGAAHLGDLINNFGGSYVLTLVAYNAGPRRSREWVQEYGDLRTGEADPIDWVESIPFQETRQYVQKVLQNLHVYRSRLAPKTVRPMSADLARGATGDGLNVASTSAPPEQAEAAEATKCAKASIADVLTTCD